MIPTPIKVIGGATIGGILGLCLVFGLSCGPKTIPAPSVPIPIPSRKEEVREPTPVLPSPNRDDRSVLK